MKKIFLFTFVIIFHNMLLSQGLENVIVEKYYITDKSDAKYKGDDKIAANFVTYRIYIDMKPGYNLQSVFGAPGHEMTLSTTTSFFNHPDRGSNIPNLVVEDYLSNGTVMLDSWIAMGGGSQVHYAVLKSDDDTYETVHNKQEPAILQSENSLTGIPVKERDGLKKTGALPPRVTQVGIDSLLILLDKKSTQGTGFNFTTTNGGWGCVGGATGADSLTNKVCIGQFTTDGDFYFKFNIQIGSPEFGVEQYVAENPGGIEQVKKELIISQPAIASKKSK